MWLGVGVLVIGFVAAGSRPGRLKRALQHARRTGELAPVVEAIERTPRPSQPNAWDQALSELWRAYERELAARLVMEAARRSDADIVQYWIRQVLEVEPEIAREVFTPSFVNEYFDPLVASRCGRGGCSSC
ncbi:MAG: hypothetical protein AAFS10_10715 [Myxococcota bacterium]